ncbi:MAG: hypothetical protein WBQ23_09905 [Bacteroidota bacterium]
MRSSSLIIVLTLVLSCSAFAQVKVPTDVQKAFKQDRGAPAPHLTGSRSTSSAPS